MDEQYVKHIVLQQQHSSLSYSERETAIACHLSVGTIRHLRALGLIEEKRLMGNHIIVRRRSYNCDESGGCKVI